MFRPLGVISTSIHCFITCTNIIIEYERKPLHLLLLMCGRLIALNSIDRLKGDQRFKAVMSY